MIARGVEAEILPYCQKQGIGVVGYSPMGKGLLTGKIDRERIAKMTEKDHRTRDPRFQPPELDINLAFVEKLTEIANGLGWSVAELAIAWTLRRPEVTAAIVGARSRQQIEETVTAGSKTLPQDAKESIASAISAREESLAALAKTP